MKFFAYKKSIITHFRSRKGITIVEMIIYIAIFAFLSLATVTALITTMKSFNSLRLTQNINQSATTALERMAYEIRNAYAIDATNSTFGVNPGRLTLLTKDSQGNNTTVEFYIASNQLGMKVAGVDQGKLMVASTLLTNLVFTPISTPNSSAVKIEMSLQDSRQETIKTTKFYDTIVLRGSMH